MKYFEISQLKSGSKNSNTRARVVWDKDIFLFSFFPKKPLTRPVKRGEAEQLPIKKRKSDFVGKSEVRIVKFGSEGGI